MFTPQDLEKIPKELEKLFSQLEMDIMLDIIRRMNELETIINSAIIIEIGDSETIQIGSKFTATINFILLA